MRLFYDIFGLLVFCQVAFLQTETVNLTFNDLSEYINTHSPVIEQLNQQLNLSKTERKLALAWNNPAINYAEEALDFNGATEREQFLTFSKQIEMPWTYALRHQAWNEFEKSAQYSAKARKNAFLSEIKTGYVELQSKRSYIARLNKLKEIIDKISDNAQNQTAEGTISAFDHKLIQMALFNLQARLVSIENEKRELESEWKTKLGIEQSQQLQLASEIDFKEFQPKSAESYFASLLTTPGIQKANTELVFLNKLVQVESSAIIPYVDVSAGFKRYSNDEAGYTFMISLPLPVFNQNLNRARKYKIERSLQETNLALQINMLKNRIQFTLDKIHHSAELLRTNQALFDVDADVTENVLFNYQQGIISITDVINAMQGYTESVENYYVQLVTYYEAIFNLEAEFDETLITF